MPTNSHRPMRKGLQPNASKQLVRIQPVVGNPRTPLCPRTAAQLLVAALFRNQPSCPLEIPKSLITLLEVQRNRSSQLVGMLIETIEVAERYALFFPFVVENTNREFLRIVKPKPTNRFPIVIVE